MCLELDTQFLCICSLFMQGVWLAASQHRADNGSLYSARARRTDWVGRAEIALYLAQLLRLLLRCVHHAPFLALLASPSWANLLTHRLAQPIAHYCTIRITRINPIHATLITRSASPLHVPSYSLVSAGRVGGIAEAEVPGDLFEGYAGVGG